MFEQIKQKDSSYSSLFTINFLIDLSFVQHNLFQAKDINRYAKWIFEVLSVDSQHFDLKFSLNKRHSSKKQKISLRILSKSAAKFKKNKRMS